MRNWLMNNYGFSKRELNGIFMLVLLILLSNFTPILYEKLFYKDNFSSQEQTAIQQLNLVDRYPKKDFDNFTNDFDNRKFVKKQPIYQVFDPNLIDENIWQQFGLSYKQAMAIVNYVKKGGKFYKPEDLKKMFVISPQKYQDLLPFVQIQVQERKSDFAKTFTKKERSIIEINSADSLKLDEIKGIGPAFARRIIKYRERLGGFVQKEQLFEVFGVDTAKFNEIKDQISIDIQAVQKIKINTVEFEDIKRFPYLKFKEMNAIIQYRKQHGAFQRVEDLSKILILNAQTIERIAPYISFEK